MSSKKEDEYKEIFLAEAEESYEQLNKLFTDLEKDHQNGKAIDTIFRITHTLKGNAMGMGFQEIAELSHVMEDIFNEVKAKKIILDETLFNHLFKANDKLGQLIDGLKTGNKVSFKGIKSILEVALRNARMGDEPAAQPTAGVAEIPVAPSPVTAPPVAEPVVTHVAEPVATVTDELKPAETVAEAPVPEVEKPAVEESQPVHAEVPAPVVEAPVAATELPVMETVAPDVVAEKKEDVHEEILNLDVDDDDLNDDDANDLSVFSMQTTLSDVVQVPVRKLDNLLNIVGELIIEKDSLVARNSTLGNRGNDLARLHRITSDLQYGVMDVRLAQVGFLFNKFHRIIRDVASIEKKKVQTVLEGTEIEIDRNVIKTISDSLVHLVRNSVSHGIEDAETRKKLGKPEAGVITLKATNEKDTVYIEVSDDGKGIDEDVIKNVALRKGLISEDFARVMTREDVLLLIFEPGFSSMETITSVSGRGVGMDVVKKAIESIGGKIAIETEVGKGTTFKLALPSSMAVKGALLFELCQQEYAIALSYTEAVVSLRKKDIHKVSNGLVAKYLGKTISILFLQDLFEKTDINQNIMEESAFHQSYDELDSDSKLEVVIVSYSGKYIGLVVYKLLQQKEIVEKTLSKPVDNIPLISGATILGNGNVCLVLDIPFIINRLFREKLIQKTNQKVYE